MEAFTYIIRNVAELIIVFALLFASYGIGKILPEVLPNISKMFDRKPFNCRPCSTFWSCVFLMTTNSLVNKSVIMFVAGVVVSFILFFIVYRSDQKKIVE